LSVITLKRQAGYGQSNTYQFIMPDCVAEQELCLIIIPSGCTNMESDCFEVVNDASVKCTKDCGNCILQLHSYEEYGYRSLTS